MDGRWGISIDIEGFSTNYEHSENRKNFAISALRELMDAIYKVGTLCFPGDPYRNYSDRIFAHQFGDGFIICSDFPEANATRAISIAIALMRHMIVKGFATKAAISAGDMSDIKGCYPNAVREANDETVHLGMGLMTTIPVMGTALTKAHKLASKQSGAILIIDHNLLSLGVAEGVDLRGEHGNCIDWISANLPLSGKITKKSRLVTADPPVLLYKLKCYCQSEPVPPKHWVDATFATIAIT
jgi:hypothetical protein